MSDEERASAVSDLERRLAEGRLRILLVGEAKRGKSTLGNALLGRDVLPTGAAPLTAIATTVRVGSPERVEVGLVDGTRTTSPLGDLGCFVTEHGNPVNRRGVSDVTAFVDTQMLSPGVELVDTPGTGSVFDHNTAQADVALAKMDAAIVVLSGDPPISSSERDLLRRAHGLSVRTLVVLNKVDRLTASERGEVEQFTADVVNRTVGGSGIEVFACSARTGLEARLRGDDDAWVSSGMRALSDVLWTSIRESGSADLVVSLAGAARRLTFELLDETTLTLRARALLAQERSAQVDRFIERLDSIGALRDEALAVARGEALSQRKALDESAATQEHQLIKAARDALNRALSEGAASDAAQLEARGEAVLAEFVRSQVDAWRQQRTYDLDTALVRLGRREQEHLDAAVSELREIARETLGAHLHGPAATVSLPDSSGFQYMFGPETSWNEPFTSAVRRHLPGTFGRRRVIAHLHADAERLVAKHIGRSRSDLQLRLEEATRTLTTSVETTFNQHAARARDAVEAATTAGTSPALPSGGGPGPRAPTGDGAATELEGRASGLARVLTDLHEIDSQPITSSRAQGCRDDRQREQ
ncbi:MAG: dynamin family protein [Acidimicrobiales bacterium]